MNINHLNQITPELVNEGKEISAILEQGPDFYRTGRWTVFCHDNRQLLLACMEAGLRLKHELSSTKGDEG